MNGALRVLILRLGGAVLALAAGIQMAAWQARAYSGPRSGTLACSGGPIPQNGEYVFRDLPPVHLQLEYNKKIWEAKLEHGNGETQRLILKNIGNGPQKKCVVHWTAIP